MAQATTSQHVTSQEIEILDSNESSGDLQLVGQKRQRPKNLDNLIDDKNNLVQHQQNKQQNKQQQHQYEEGEQPYKKQLVDPSALSQISMFGQQSQNLRETSTRTDSGQIMATQNTQDNIPNLSTFNNNANGSNQMSNFNIISSMIPFGSVQTPLSQKSMLSLPAPSQTALCQPQAHQHQHHHHHHQQQAHLHQAQTLENQIFMLRGKYPEIVMTQNENEDNWRCDICLSYEGEDDDELSICDLCMVVVHPSCYRRDLYDQDPNDDSPWFCARCKHLLKLQNQPKNFSLNQFTSPAFPPSCSLCPDQTGAIIDMKDNSWVHISCVNWINEIWFEADDRKMTMYGGQLDFGRYSLTCYLCQKKEGQCIECDLKTCRKPFHVRCAMKHGFILPPDQMDSRLGDWDCKVFCGKHQRKGVKQVKDIKAARDHQKKNNNNDQANCFDVDGNNSLECIQTRLKSGIRKSIINEIDLDDVVFSSNDDANNNNGNSGNGKNEQTNMSSQIKATLEDVNDVAKKPVAKAKKSAGAKQRPLSQSQDFTQESTAVLDLPTIKQTEKKQFVAPIISNTKAVVVAQNPHLTTIAVKKAATRQCQSRKTLQIEDINTECKVKFKIDKALSNYLGLNEWCTFKDLTIGFLKFHQKVQDFYDKPNLSFNAYKYPFFTRFFPDQAKITSMDLKKYLLRKHQ